MKIKNMKISPHFLGFDDKSTFAGLNLRWEYKGDVYQITEVTNQPTEIENWANILGSLSDRLYRWIDEQSKCSEKGKVRE